MKKIIFVMMAALALVVSACKPTPEKLAEKIAKGETLTPEEYTDAIDYSENIVSVINDSIAANEGDFQGIVRALKAINIDYPEANAIMEGILTADPSTLDENTRTLRDNLLKKLDVMAEAIQKQGPVFRTESLQKATDDLKSDENQKAEKQLEDEGKVVSDSVAKTTRLSGTE